MIDAHNHLQQLPDPGQALAEAQSHGVTGMLVNGTCEQDWPQVARLAAGHPEVLPAFGLHPWQVPERSPAWLSVLRNHLNDHPQANLGECGLDRWKKPFDLADQLDCLQSQLDLANELRRPLTIHCLQAWGPLLEILRNQETLPPFLLHAYSGSTELIPALVELGGYFSFNGYFLHERKDKIRETFRHIPLERLLLESDAPAMLPPTKHQLHPLAGDQNHPANLASFLPPLAALLKSSVNELKDTLAVNFSRYSEVPAEE